MIDPLPLFPFNLSADILQKEGKGESGFDTKKSHESIGAFRGFGSR